MAPLDFPRSDAIVRIRAIDTTMHASLFARAFMEPELEGFDTLNLTGICFLIESPTLNKRILFDCGPRKDFEEYPPAIKSRLNRIIKGLKIDADVNDVLVDAGVGLDSIDSIVWSHWHWDHTGAASKFPASVEIVVGPGFKKTYMPGYPTDPDSPMLDADYRGRDVREISFTNNSLHIGQFAAHDFFGDGSFYLLDSPGHALGHMCGLARTTATSPAFVFMGGDICHFSGMFRPSSKVPLPEVIPADQLDGGLPSPCPCSFFEHPLVKGDSEVAACTPFFNVTSVKPSSYLDREKAMGSIRAMQDFDASPNILMCIAHDPALPKTLPVLNSEPHRDLNDWQAQGYKEKLLWTWLNDLPRNGKPGRPDLIHGTRRDGRDVTDFEKLKGSC